MRGKTRLMLRAEERVGMPLEKALPELYNRFGLTKSAEMMGVSHSTVWYWYLRFGIKLVKAAELRPQPP